MQRRHATSKNSSGTPLPTYDDRDSNKSSAAAMTRRSNPGAALFSHTNTNSRSPLMTAFGCVIVLLFCFTFFDYESGGELQREGIEFIHTLQHPEEARRQEFLSNNQLQHPEEARRQEFLSNNQSTERNPTTTEKVTSDVATTPSREKSRLASEAMLAQPSTHVDGEKHLKKRLVKLMERQQKGIDVGAEHLTRWQGKDVPVWTPADGKEVQFDDYVSNPLDKTMHKSDQQKNEELKEKNDEKNENIDDKTFELLENDKTVGMFDDKVKNKNVHNQEGEDEEETEEDGKSILLGQRKTQPKNVFDPVEHEDEEKEVDVADINFEDAETSKPTFPYPTDFIGKDARILLKPTFGEHRPSVDAVFALAEGYDLKIYLQFLQSLANTGFDGDIVLSVSSFENMQPGVQEYLKAQKNLVVYTMNWDCRDRKDGSATSNAKEGVNLCKANGMYKTPKIESVKDPRDPRPVATVRYELYWIWATHYDDDSMIMLIDSRDTFFQTNPFAAIQRTSQDSFNLGGVLHVFGENAEASNIGQSSFNSRWLLTAYGNDVKEYFTKPIICSGSTMGEKIALEIYLRAMVTEFDETKCVLKGCDQGFHNYLYYSHKLENVPGINEIILHEQGHGVINNLAALRSKTLREQKVFDKNNKVLNWDGSISPVAHQGDRDDEVRIFMNQMKKDYLQEWRNNKP